MQFGEFETDNDVYQLPLTRSQEPSSTKLEEAKDLDLENEEGESSEAEWIAGEDQESADSPSPQQKAEELQRLHTQFEQIKQSLLVNS